MRSRLSECPRSKNTAPSVVATRHSIRSSPLTSSSLSCTGKAASATLDVRPAAHEDFAKVAQLRADAYYEDDMSRFASSRKKQFAEHEEASLRARTGPRKLPRTTDLGMPLCECLVAVEGDEDSKAVVGCIDIRLPKAITGHQDEGVPDEDINGCYILNVVVQEKLRGRGIGKLLMKAVMERAVLTWGSKNMYAHVEAQNEVAIALYRGCGFSEHSASVSKYGNAINLGRLILLQATAETVSSNPAE